MTQTELYHVNNGHDSEKKYSEAGTGNWKGNQGKYKGKRKHGQTKTLKRKDYKTTQNSEQK